MIKHDGNQAPSAGIADLPEFDPDPALWTRIQRGHARRVIRRRLIRAGGFSASGAVVAIVILLGARGDFTGPSGTRDVTDGRFQSQALQNQSSAVVAGPQNEEVSVSVRRVDRELQMAYDQGADASRLRALWALRNQLLESLAREDGVRGLRLTRI